jgi:hypothetical protein
VAEATIDARRAPSYVVFISYSNLDKDFANDLVFALEKQQFGCWIAPRDIPEGAPSWAEPIVTAIANSRLVVVLLTLHSIHQSKCCAKSRLQRMRKSPCYQSD